MKTGDRFYTDILIVESGNTVYVAQAPVGTPKTEPAWQVMRIVSEDDEVEVSYAEQNPAFVHPADNLPSLNYPEGV